MTRMLASVTGPEEAAIALAGGADIIDLKDPSRGALGAVDVATVRRTVGLVAGRRPVSAVAGDLPMEPAPLVAAVAALAETGVDHIKLGIFPGGDASACIEALAPQARTSSLIAVFFADFAPAFALLPLLAAAGFTGAMIDTANKGSARLLDHMDVPRLRQFVIACRHHGLMSGLAGSLEPPDVPRLLVLAPDLLGFRGALCGNAGRTGAIAPEAVQAVRALIPPEHVPGDRRATDVRLLAARAYAPDQRGSATDCVFVHDLVLPVRIGAYAHERTAPQRVRFDVDAMVSRPARPTADMRDVFSYDVISDGIRMLIDAGHVPLVETLAERIAGLVLAHPWVVRVTVRIEKLDTGSGSVGVAIERSHADRVLGVDEIFGFAERSSPGRPA
jgi:dihydroneopterin aldolase